MPVFEYEVIDRAGAVAKGRQQAEDQDEVMELLRQRGQLVVSLRAAGAGRGASLGEAIKRALGGLGHRVRLATLVLFTGQLAAMLEAGIHLVRVLTSLSRDSDDKRFGAILTEVRDSLAAGMTFADALGQYPRIFSRLFVAVVRAGEASGSLHVVLNSLTVNLEKAEHLRRKVKGAVSYPIAILTIAILIVFAMIVKIVPIFEEVYAKANARLPAPTLMLIAISRAVRDYTLFVSLGVVLLVVALVWAARTERGRDLFDMFKLRVPIFGPLIRKAVIARTCRTLGLLLQSGIPLMEALDISKRVAGNRMIERALVFTALGVRDGGTLAQMMQETGAFPSMVTQLVGTGEESGSLAAMLGKAANYYEAQVDAAVDTLSTLIEPIMIVVMGGIAGGVIFALYLPIFNLGQAMRGGLK